MSARFRFGIFELDIDAGTLSKNGFPVKLPPQPFKLLHLLVSQPAVLVTRDELQRALWGESTFVDFELGINRCIKQIRQALGDDPEAPRYVETVPRRGYRFIAPVEARSEAPTQEAAPAGSGPRDSAKNGIPFELSARSFLAAHPVAFAAAAVVAAIVIATMLSGRLAEWRASTGRAPAFQPIRSLAVLPLLNLSSNSPGYFAEGMTDELISDIGELCPIRVISHASVMRFNGSKLGLPKIARVLGADAAVEGSVLRSGGKVRITVQLFDARKDRLLWASTYEGSERDVLALQDNVATEIARQIQSKLASRISMPAAQVRTVEPEAYDDYLKGRFEWEQRTPESLKKSVAYFEEAIQKDSSYAPAYAGLADADVLMSDFNLLPPGQAYAQGAQAASTALRLNPSLSDAYASQGIISMNRDWDWAGAEAAFKKAIFLNPSDAAAHQWYSFLLSCEGRSRESIAEAELAQRIDPLSLLMDTQVAAALYWARDYHRAVQQLREAINLEPRYPWTHFRLAEVQAQEGSLPAAMAELSAFPTLLKENASFIVLAAQICGKAGKRDQGRKMLDRLRGLASRQYVSPSDTALVYAGLGEKKKALEWLNKAYAEHDDGLNLLKVEPLYDSLRHDSQFQALLGAMRLDSARALITEL
ncbi:MAG: winged helix-turn-helix domain-containing protein [Terriglobia bacterium]